MIEDATVDYDRVHSSTATEDGNRIVLTLDACGVLTSISLPSSDVPRLVAAVSTAAGMAKVAQTGKPSSPALRVRNLQVRVHPIETELLLVVELIGGSELVFQVDLQTGNHFLKQYARALELASSPGTGGSLQ